MKGYLKLLLAMCIYILVFSTTSYAGFSDINAHWCEEKINDFYESGFVEGYEDGSFRPDKSITRAELCKIINLYMNYEVASGDWQATNMEVAKEKGYLAVGEANSTISREEAFVVFSRLMGLENVEFELEFIDANDISIWAVSSVKSLALAEYIKGYTTNELKPKKDITRAEVISVLYEYVGIGGVDEEAENVEFNIGYLSHNKYGIEFVEIDDELEIEIDETVTLAATLTQEDGDVIFEIVDGEEYVEFDTDNLILEGIKKGIIKVRATTTLSNKKLEIIIIIK